MHRFESVTKPPMWSMALLLAALMAGCWNESNDPVLGGVAVGGIPGAPAGAIIPGAACTTAGPTIPTVTSSSPANGDPSATTGTTGVAGGGKLITANFSLVMNPATINSNPAGTLLTFTLKNNSSGSNVLGTVAMNAGNTIATFTTAAALSAGTSYTGIITRAATSAGGTALSCIFAWNFVTVTPAAAGPATVNLGLAAPFAIAAAAGVTNDLVSPPNTTINGNVVLDDVNNANLGAEATCNAVTVGSTGSFGLCGGLPPAINGQVLSFLFPDAGVTSGAIKSDLNATYLRLTPANTPGATLLGCGTIGTGSGAGAGVGCVSNNNATIPPGVYLSATSSTIGVTGVLTLDGQGDQNAQFIFQAPSTLTTAAGALGAPGSEIRLINGAKASNVWWQVGSSATIGTFAVFQGNVLADTSITMGNQSTSCGRLLAGAVTATGAFTFDGNVVSVPGHPNAPASCQ